MLPLVNFHIYQLGCSQYPKKPPVSSIWSKILWSAGQRMAGCSSMCRLSRSSWYTSSTSIAWEGRLLKSSSSNVWLSKCQRSQIMSDACFRVTTDISHSVSLWSKSRVNSTHWIHDGPSFVWHSTYGLVTGEPRPIVSVLRLTPRTRRSVLLLPRHLGAMIRR